MSQICRLCLESGASDDIFENDGSLASRIVSCCRLHPQINDGLPSVVCKNCQNNLNHIWSFQTLCHQSDRQLRSRLTPFEEGKGEVFIKIERKSPELEFEDYTNEIKPETDDVDVEDVKIEIEYDKIDIPMPETQNYECDLCNQKFCDKFQVQSHIKLKHSIKAEKELTAACPFCGKLLSPHSLSNHLKIHMGKVKTCVKCDKQFPTAYKLNRHMLTHVNKVPPIPHVPCDQCDKLFTSDKGLRDHQRLIHVAVYRRQCAVCFKCLSSKKSYNNHLKIHTGQRDYECDLCGKKFIRKDSLRDHIRMHDNFRPFTCTTCNQSFTKSFYLTEHMRLHTGDKPFKCLICEKAFAQCSNMRSHMKSLHKTIV